MKKPRTIQTRRKTPKSPLRMLQAATGPSRKRRQRASTATAEDLGEVPGVGIARALVVILLLHVAAIAGIWMHNEMTKENDLKATVPAEPDDSHPTPIEGADRAIVSTGDNYARLAARLGVDEQALRRANENKVLRAGWTINVPERRVAERPLPEGHRQARVNPPRLPQAQEAPHRPVERPLIQTADSQTRPGSRPGDMVENGAIPPAQPRTAQRPDTDNPVYIRQPARETTPQPRIEQPRVEQPRVAEPVVRQPEPRPEPAPARRSHTIKSGDNFYRLSRKYGVSVADIKRANPGVKPTSLKLGQSINIPGR